MLFSVVTLLALATLAQAHTRIYQVSGSTVGLRAIRPAGDYEGNPVTDVLSSDVKCNSANPGPVTPRDVSPGQSLFFEYAHNAPGPADDIMDKSHIGPCLIYAARGPGATDWVKLWHEGYENGQWCTVKMINNRGITWTIPSNMPSGYWVLRVEVIALHGASSQGGAQLYMRCMDINVSGSNNGTPSPLVKFPGIYTPTSPGILFNPYVSSIVYPIPGGPVGSFSGTVQSPSPSPSPKSPSPSPKSPSPSPKSPSPSPKTSPSPSGPCITRYNQCGGMTYQGATCCQAPYTCKFVNDYYSQCN